MDAVQIYFKYVGISIRSQLQYKVSFFLMVLGHFILTGVDIVGVWALFEHFDKIDGWGLAEVAFLYGLVNISFSFASIMGTGFDHITNLLKTGDFDRILLRPRSAVLQVAFQTWALNKVGRLIQAVLVFGWAISVLGVSWDGTKILILGLAILGGMCLFYGLFIVQATLAFWTTESLELMNILTYGGTEVAQYPLSIYFGWFRKFFTFIVPIASISYFPSLAIMGRDGGAWFYAIAPTIGIAFFCFSLVFWRFGVRRYHSAGG